MRKFTTQDGGSVEFTAVQNGYDVRTRNVSGDTISSVILPEDEAAQYMTALAAIR